MVLCSAYASDPFPKNRYNHRKVRPSRFEVIQYLSIGLQRRNFLDLVAAINPAAYAWVILASLIRFPRLSRCADRFCLWSPEGTSKADRIDLPNQMPLVPCNAGASHVAPNNQD